jgi:peptide/nickel transport system ATP-binding protein
LTSMPRLSGDVDEELIPIQGTPPSLLAPPPGCPFHPRCEYMDQVAGDKSCNADRPTLPAGRGAACHLTDAQKQTYFVEQIKPRLG